VWPYDYGHLSFDLAQKMGVQNQHFANGSNTAGYDWLSGFPGRHPYLAVRMPEATSISRTEG